MFTRPYKEVFRQNDTLTPLTPRALFPKHASCKDSEDFVTDNIVGRIRTRAVKVSGKVGFF